MKNSADLGGCYPPRPSASVDNTLLYLQNSSYPTQPHSIIANYWDVIFPSVRVNLSSVSMLTLNGLTGASICYNKVLRRTWICNFCRCEF